MELGERLARTGRSAAGMSAGLEALVPGTGLPPPTEPALAAFLAAVALAESARASLAPLPDGTGAAGAGISPSPSGSGSVDGALSRFFGGGWEGGFNESGLGCPLVMSLSYLQVGCD